MIPILYDSNESAFVSNGLCRLKDIISCTVVEERNSIYECNFEYPVDGANYDLIKCGRIIAVVHDDTEDIQPFDIVSFSRPINGVVTFHAVHISYRQSKLTASGTNVNSLAGAFDLLKTATPSNPFTYWTNKASSGNFFAADDVPHTVRQMLGGMEGSILDCYGGEYEWDKWTVKLWDNRGIARDITIRYGINLMGYDEDVDYSEAYTSCIPFWVSNDNEQTVVKGNKVTVEDIPYNGRESCVPLDLTDKFEERPTAQQLQNLAADLMRENKSATPTQTIKVEFIRLQDSTEYASYANLMQCRLCDSINVVFPMYGTSGSFKIVKTVYDVLQEKFDSMELGTLSVTLSEALGINSNNSVSYHGSGGGGGGGAVTGVKGNEEATYRTGNVNLTAAEIGALPSNTPIHNVPSGGSSGQVLTKNSGTDYDLTWGDGSGVTDVKVNGTSVVSSGVANVPVSRKTVYGVVKTAFNNDPGGGVVSITHHNSGGTETTGYAPLVQYLNGDYQPIRAKLLPDATTTTKGALSAADKTKLDKVILDANDKIDTSILPTANASDYGAIKLSSGPSSIQFTYSNGSTVNAPILNGSNLISASVMPDATTTTKGAMSTTDKAIVDSIPSGGTSGQVLTKSSGTDYDFTWADKGVTDVKVYGNSVVSSGVANIPKMTGATSSTHGAVGVVPQPLSGEQAKFLFGDGTWDSIWASTANTGIDTFRIDITKYNGNYPSLTQIEIPAATTTKAGIMTAADRTKLNSLSVLPVGSVYESTSSTNPSTDLGNTWTLLGTTDLTSATAIGTSGGDDIVTSEGDTLGFGIVTYKFERTA